jgi:putative ABC transport system substrate-binding protein
MRRREFITLLGGAAIAWPLAARAQQPAMPVIGFLHSGSPGPYASRVAAFRRGLNKSGLVEGKNIAIEYRWAEGHYDRLPGLAADLVRRQASVIVAAGGVESAPAAKAATMTIPIVFAIGVDPIGLGLVTNLARPEGNITGLSSLTSELASKRLGLLNELAPASRSVAALVNPTNRGATSTVSELEAAGHALGRRIQVLNARNETEIDNAFETLANQRADALLVLPDPFFTSRIVQIVTSASRRALPVIYPAREYAEAGGLLSYGAAISDQYRELGVYTARILKGEKPSDLPVMQSTKFELVINLTTAKALGLEIPPMLLARADEVIE